MSDIGKAKHPAGRVLQTIIKALPKDSRLFRNAFSFFILYSIDEKLKIWYANIEVVSTTKEQLLQKYAKQFSKAFPLYTAPGSEEDIVRILK